jgi:hypothetical protein
MSQKALSLGYVESVETDNGHVTLEQISSFPVYRVVGFVNGQHISVSTKNLSEARRLFARSVRAIN